MLDIEKIFDECEPLFNKGFRRFKAEAVDRIKSALKAQKTPSNKARQVPEACTQISAIADSLDDMNQVSVYDRNKINQHIAELRKLLPC